MSIGILAILFGLIAAYGVRSLLVQKEVEAPPKPPPAALTTVPVASENLPADRLISTGDVSLVRMTQQQLFQRLKGMDYSLIMTSSKDIIGRRLRKSLKQGQPFLTTALYLQGTGPSLTDRLQPGFRAVSLRVADNRGGNVQPGTHVDVLFRSQARPAKAGQPAIPEMTVVLLRHIEVLEVDRPTQAAGETKSLVTLAVPEGKVRIFGTVDGRGELWLVATSPQEPEPEGLAAVAALGSGSTLEELLGIRLPEPAKPAPPPFQTAIFRRGQMQVNTFVDGQLVSQARTWSPGPTSASPGGAKAAEPAAQAAPSLDPFAPADADRAAPVAAPGEPIGDRPTPALPSPAGKNN